MAFLAKLFGKKKDNKPDEKVLAEEEGLTSEEEAAAEAERKATENTRLLRRIAELLEEKKQK